MKTTVKIDKLSFYGLIVAIAFAPLSFWPAHYSLFRSLWHREEKKAHIIFEQLTKDDDRSQIVWEARMCVIMDVSHIVYRIKWMRNIISYMMFDLLGFRWLNKYLCVQLYIYFTFIQWNNIVIYRNNNDERDMVELKSNLFLFWISNDSQITIAFNCMIAQHSIPLISWYYNITIHSVYVRMRCGLDFNRINVFRIHSADD